MGRPPSSDLPFSRLFVLQKIKPSIERRSLYGLPTQGKGMLGDSGAAAAEATRDWSRLVAEGWVMAAKLSVGSPGGELGEAASGPAESKQASAESEVVIEDVAEDKQQAEEEDSSDDARVSPARRKAAPVVQEPFEKKDLDDTARAQIMDLHGKGKNAAQIKNFYLLTDYGLTEEVILDIVREGAAKKSSASGRGEVRREEEATKTYSPLEMKEWLACLKNGDLERMKELLRAHPSLLDAKQPGIGNSALHWVQTNTFISIMPPVYFMLYLS